MTNSISNITASISSQQPTIAKQADANQASAEAVVQPKEAYSRLKQVGQLLQASRSAALMQIARCNQLAVEGLGRVDPTHAEVLRNPELMEDFRRKQRREADLVTSSQQVLSKSDRTQADLSRALIFLMPHLRPAEEEDGISLPGFNSPMKDPSALDTSGLIWDSHSDFYAQISAMISVLQSEWLSEYQDALGKFLEFYQEFSDIMEKLKFEARNDKGDVDVDFKEVKAALTTLAAKYGMNGEALGTFSSRQQADAFKASLGLPDLVVTESGGVFYVKMDLSAVNSIKDSMTVPADGSKFWMDAAHYNSWISAKDSNMEQIKHVSKVLGEKLSEMTQKFDNIVKILSSTIDKITEADKSFLQF
jgi:type III secretion system IpaD/SipD/SspD family effector